MIVHTKNFSATKVERQAKTLGIVNIQALGKLIKDGMANEHLKQLLKKYGKKQRHLVDVLNLTESAISHIFTGERKSPLTIDEGVKISKWLQAPLHEVLNISQEELAAIPPSRKQVLVVGSIGDNGFVEYYGEHKMKKELVYLPAGIDETDIQKIEIKTDSLPDPYSTYEYALVSADRHFDPQRVANAATKLPCIVTTSDGISQPVKIFPGTKPGKFHIQKLDNNIVQDVQILTCQLVHSWVLKKLA